MGTMMMNIPAAQQVVATFVSDLPFVIALPVAFMLLAILLVYVSRASEARRLYVALLQYLVVFMAWTTADSNIMREWYTNAAFWHHASLAMLFLIPVSGNYVGYVALEPPRRSGVRWILAINVLTFLFATVSEALGLGGYAAVMPLLYGTLPFFEGYVFYQLWQSARRGNRQSWSMLIPFVLVTVLGVIDGVNTAVHFTSQPMHFMPFGVFSFFIVVLQFLQDQLLREHKLENQTAHLAYQAAIAQERAEIDVLTGCRNRLSYEMTIREAIAAARQSGRPLSFLMFDIDHFKNYNDTYGHEAGDEVLRKFSGVVRQMLDKAKPFFRWGGEEFIVICGGCDLDEAAVLGNAIRQSVGKNVVVRGQHVTVSIGASTWHGSFDTAEQFFQRADAALYTAKGDGRNCLRVELPAAVAANT
jgi:diguanylate cyclase (GGDEF)-like protein